jgi:hypothetical protein
MSKPERMSEVKERYSKYYLLLIAGMGVATVSILVGVLYAPIGLYGILFGILLLLVACVILGILQFKEPSRK